MLVSNNPYQLSHLRGAATRPRARHRRLGVVSVLVRGAVDVEKFAALEAVGQVRRFSGWNEWTAAEFEVTSDGPVEIGVDGEALTMEPPLRFASGPVRSPCGCPCVLSRRHERTRRARRVRRDVAAPCGTPPSAARWRRDERRSR